MLMLESHSPQTHSRGYWMPSLQGSGRPAPPKRSGKEPASTPPVTSWSGTSSCHSRSRVCSPPSPADPDATCSRPTTLQPAQVCSPTSPTQGKSPRQPAGGGLPRDRTAGRTHSGGARSGGGATALTEVQWPLLAVSHPEEVPSLHAAGAHDGRTARHDTIPSQHTWARNKCHRLQIRASGAFIRRAAPHAPVGSAAPRRLPGAARPHRARESPSRAAGSPCISACGVTSSRTMRPCVPALVVVQAAVAIGLVPCTQPGRCGVLEKPWITSCEAQQLAPNSDVAIEVEVARAH